MENEEQDNIEIDIDTQRIMITRNVDNYDEGNGGNKTNKKGN